MTDGFEPRVTEGWQSFYLINKCTNNVGLHVLRSSMKMKTRAICHRKEKLLIELR